MKTVENGIETMHVQIWDGVNEVRTDGATDAIKVIAYSHHEVHDGSHYFIEGYAALGLNGTLYVKLVTPNTKKWAHFLWTIGGVALTTTTLVEGPTGGMAGGSPVTIFNSNRNSLKTSGLVITSGVTAPTGGTIISQESFGSKQTSGSTSRGEEIILKQNTTYCRTFLSGAASNVISFRATWYEHTNL